MDKGYQMIHAEMVLIEIRDGEDKHNQSRDQSVRREEQFFLVINEDKGCAHPT